MGKRSTGQPDAARTGPPGHRDPRPPHPAGTPRPPDDVRFRRILEAVRALGAEIVRGPEAPPLLASVVRHAAEILGAELCAIYLWDREAGLLVPAAQQGYAGILTPLRPGQGVAGRVAESRRGTIVNEYRASPHALPHVLAGSSIESLVAEPLLAGDTLIGVIAAARDAPPRPFSEEERGHLAILAAYATIAVESTRQLAASGRRAAQLTQLTTVTRSLMAVTEPTDVYREIHRAVRALLPESAVRVWMCDAAGTEARLVTGVGFRDPEGGRLRVVRRGERLFGAAVFDGQPVTSEDVTIDPRFVNQEWARTEGLVSALLCPMLRGGLILGFISIFTRHRHRFDPDEIDLFRAFATQAAIAVENARLLETVRAALAERTRREEEYRTILQAAIDGFWLADEQGRLLDVNDAYARMSGYGRDELLGMRIQDLEAAETEAETVGHIRRLIEHGSDRFETRHRRKDGSLVDLEVSASHLPLDGGRLVIFLRDISGRKREAAALAERTRQLEAIRETAAEITRELDLGKLLALITQRANALLGSRTGTVRLWDEATQLLVPQGWTGEAGAEPGRIPLRPGEGVAGAVALRREGLIVNEFRTSPYATSVLLGATHTAVLAEPLMYHGRLIGVISVDNGETGKRFTTQDQELLRLLAAQAAIAIENARLHTAAVRRGEELTALLRAANSVVGGPDLPTILERILGEAARVAGSSHVKILLADPEAGVLRIGALQGTAMAHGHAMPIGAGLSGIVAATGEPVYSPDTPADPRNPFQAGDRELGIVSYLGLPIKSRDRVVGVLAFNTTSRREYAPDEMAYLGAFADQAAIAIEIATLFRQERSRRQQLEAIRTVTEEITRELELPTLLRLISQRALDLLGGSSGVIWLWDETAQRLQPAAWHGLGDWMAEQTRAPGEGIPGIVAQTRIGLIVNDYRSSTLPEAAFKARTDIAATVAEPLLYRDRLVGVITVNDDTDTQPRFSHEDRRSLSLLAGQAAIAIENARLYAELKTSYERIQTAQDELVRTEKLRGLGQMAAGIAHDLNNMLAAVLGQTELLKLQASDPTVRESLATLETAATDGAHVVRRLQDFARQRPGLALEPCRLDLILHEVVELTRPRWQDEAQRRGIAIGVECALPAELPPVLGNPPEIREALTNLILNAVDAMPQGGTLTLGARPVPGPGGGADRPSPIPGPHPPAPDPECVELWITDTGIGMTPEVQARIFDPFFTTKGLHGTGLGLSVVFGIMERHGGRIGVTSTPGRGTTFTLRLPTAATLPGQDPPPDPVLPSRRRLLVIDDEASVRKTLASLLRAKGHTVFEADSGPAGLALLARERVECVLCDLGMPEMTGWEVARRVAAAWSGLPVLLLTGWGEQMAGERPADVPLHRILGKPIRIEELIEAIREAADTRP